jgi:uncharacterized surface protein with fasciclin (FAS1) repeats
MVPVRTLTLSSVATLSLLVTGCDDKVLPVRAEVPSESLLDLLMSEGLTEFIALAETAGIGDSLESEQQLTLFAPTNAALAAIPESVKSDPEMLSTYLRFHFVGGRQKAQLVSVSDQLLTNAGSYMGVDVSGSTVTLLGAEGSEAVITKSDLPAFNGILHVIDAVLVPTAPPGPGTVIEVATELGLESFVAAVMSARLDDDLSAEGAVFNVLAPNEAAFEAFTAEPSSDILANILLHHVVLGTIPTASIAEGAELPTAAGTTVVVPALGAAVVAETNNGTLTEVSAVALPPTTLEFLEGYAETSSLAALVAAAPGAVEMALDPDTLAGTPDDPVTLFAPVNAALTSSIAPGDLGNVLERHIVIGHVPTSSLTDGLDLTTLNGTLTVSVDAQGNISVDDGDDTANVLGEIRTLSGVIHLIDAVLLP